MHLNFTLLLFIAVLVSGGLVALNWLWLKKRRSPASQPGLIIEYAQSFFPVLALIFVLRSFLFEPFQIPSGSMLPTLKIGDFILVNKFSYGVRLPIINKKIIEVNQPQAGDVAVFRYPLNEEQNYIKRLVAMPGDKVSFRNNTLYLNGQPLSKKLLASSLEESPDEQLWQESFGEKSYQVIHYPLPHYQLPEIIIPEGYYLAMGDNRDHSSDSRFWCSGQVAEHQGCFAVPGYFNAQGQPLVVGLVADHQLVGKATAVWMHWPKFFSLPNFFAARFID